MASGGLFRRFQHPSARFSGTPRSWEPLVPRFRLVFHLKLRSSTSLYKVILNLNEMVSIIVSAVIAVGYTLLGGLISVCYTDVIQIFLIFLGMFLALPFAFPSLLFPCAIPFCVSHFAFLHCFSPLLSPFVDWVGMLWKGLGCCGLGWVVGEKQNGKHKRG